MVALGMLAFATSALLMLLRWHRSARSDRGCGNDARACDTLTGLASRLGFEQSLPPLAESLRGGARLAVLVVDVDRFRRLCYRIGWHAGDSILRDIGTRLQAFPDACLAARVGPDSFALAMTRQDLVQIDMAVAALLETLASPFSIGADVQQRISISLGCGVYPDETDTPSRLLGIAERAVPGQSERRVRFIADNLDPYGAEAAQLLTRMHPHLDQERTRLAARLARLLRAAPRRGTCPQDASTAQRDVASDEEIAMARHFECVARADLSATEHRAQARRIGRLHAAHGLAPAVAVAMSYRISRWFTVMVQRIPGRFSQRAGLKAVIARRLEADLAMQQDGAASLQEDLRSAMQALARALQRRHRRADILESILAATSAFPFIKNCAIYARTAEGTFVVEAESPEHRIWLAGHAALQISGRPSSAIATHAVTRAWRSGVIEEVPPAQMIASGLAAAGVRACVALPLLDSTGHTTLALVLHGLAPNLFGTSVFTETLELLRVLASRELERLRAEPVAPPVAASERAFWRTRLFDGGLRCFMQPIADLKQSVCTKVEALARIQLPNGVMIGPQQFLPVLSQLDLDELFVAGLHQCLGLLRDWEQQGVRIDLSLNLPPSTLRNLDCMRWVETALARHGVDAARLTLELLENEELVDASSAHRQIHALRKLGVHLALDDLGSGYSSLLRLRDLPVDVVKIDQSLVRGITAGHRRSVNLVAYLVELARGLDAKITIEGLETPMLLDFAQFLEADYGQGYAIARPMPSEAIPAWLAAYRVPPPSGHNPYAGTVTSRSRHTGVMLQD